MILSRSMAVVLLLAGLAPAESREIPPLTRRGEHRAASTQPTTQPELDDLTRRIINGERADDLPAEVTRAMADAGKRLTQEHDPGERTQDLQQQALRDLDALLTQARRSSHSRRQQQSSTNQQAQSSGAQAGSARVRQQTASNRPATEERDTGGAVSEPRGHAAPPDLRRRWGELPQRDREALMQGSSEQSLPRYREWVERYYRSLAQPRHAATETQPGA